MENFLFYGTHSFFSLRSRLEEKFWRIARGWSIVFSDYFGNFRYLVEWQWNGGTWRPSEHAHFLGPQPVQRRRKPSPLDPRDAELRETELRDQTSAGTIFDLTSRRPLSDFGD